ncbi:hypothetical protein Y1Q_0022701 [Alligator mississippiensis]|uniref:Uncharacterized protein n=1 Tax=Alligator mississippiensis TaxID=8496 RepID=A0A151MYG1_ALLMI|nr:hypothetical protein Y1Q_0022701 [Alligator mississippiensis]
MENPGWDKDRLRPAGVTQELYPIIGLGLLLLPMWPGPQAAAHLTYVPKRITGFAVLETAVLRHASLNPFWLAWNLE